MEEPLLQTKSELNKLKSSKIQFSNSLKVTTPLRLDSIIYSQKDYDENISLYEFDSERESLSQVDDVENFIIPYTSKGDINEDSIIFKSKYSFIQTYLSLIKESKIIHSYPSMLKFKLEVNVRDYTMEEGTFFNYIRYNIEGKINEKEFAVYRRYSEFIQFRKLLQYNWPGLVIHQIPPKKSFGNLDDGFINLRKKFLQQFINRLAASPHLASSYETKIFLEPRNESFLDLPLEIYQRPISDIYKIYSNYFNFLQDLHLSEKEKLKVQSFYLNLMKTKQTFDTLNYVVTEAKNVQSETEYLIKNFYENNFDTENSIYDMLDLSKEKKEILNKNTIELNLTETMYQTKYESLYTTYYEWVSTELINTTSMIEAIQCLYKFNQTFEDKIELLKKKNQELKENSNLSIIQQFFFQIDLNSIQMKINEINNLKEEIEIYKKLIDLIYKILYFIEIPTFKRDQYQFYISFINKIDHDESGANEKNEIMYKLIKNHCKSIFEVSEELENERIKKKKEYNKDKEEIKEEMQEL
jgi:sorting nexin-1/2